MELVVSQKLSSTFGQSGIWFCSTHTLGRRIGQKPGISYAELHRYVVIPDREVEEPLHTRLGGALNAVIDRGIPKPRNWVHHHQ